MSAVAARAAAPARRPAEPRRHLEIAPSRAQRRARPRLAHAVVTLLGIAAILLAQLGLSMALADGAYRISTLQLEQRDLLRDGEALSESLESLQSPQFLAQSAEALGMVASGSLPYIDLSSGEITGTAGDAGGSLLGSRGGLVGNVTIDGVPLVEGGPAAGAGDAAADAEGTTGETPAPGTVPPGTVVPLAGSAPSGASSSPGAAGSVSSGTTTLPSPTTR